MICKNPFVTETCKTSKLCKVCKVSYTRAHLILAVTQCGGLIVCEGIMLPISGTANYGSSSTFENYGSISTEYLLNDTHIRHPLR